jgi:CheY-like chemotaxis protein
VAKNGKQGVEFFEASEPGYYAAVLMDNLMPVMNGLEATLYIRGLSRRDAASIPIIAVSANAYEDDKQKAAEAKMDGYVTKPIEPIELYTMMKRLIK